ncbi:interferon lambda receptor 1 isoform X2 [Takifugu flavidus]|uniref:interferon lambda receptor 1 isoform X2 n=1 Tax=Takifugu flavidus TaxID=433684 RepID=UPI0025441751|nr:interferon lambda receptor 1 isoform X2 [Takifugu flavidus]
MNMWILNAVILSLFCSVCLSTENESVYFISKNFNNILHWIAVDPARPGENITYKYSVEYKKHADGEKYRKKAGCQNITTLLCDLTEETPAIRDGHYWARVFVNGELHGCTKTRFTPLAHTTFGPPTLSINSTVSALHVHAIPPLGPNGESIRDIVARSTEGPVETQLLYTLEITDPQSALQVKTNTTGQFILNLTNNNKYCGHVFYRPTAKWGRSTSEKTPFCIKLPANPPDFLPWLLFTAVFLLALLLMSFVCVCKYVKGVKSVSTPSVLIISKTPTAEEVLQPQNKADSISELVVYLDSAKRETAAIHLKHSVPSTSLGGYSPQDIPCQIGQDSSTDHVLCLTSDPKDNSAQSSVSYGAVVVHDSTEDQGAIKNKLNSSLEECGSDHAITSVMLSHTGSPLSVQDSPDSDPSRPLLLHTERDSDGNLVLPFPSFQFQSSTANLQRRPLLSDLIDSTMAQPSLSSLLILDGAESECDDGIVTSPTQTYCNSHYHQPHAGIPSPHQANLNSSSTDGRVESCYMQNWIPEVNVETVAMHSDFDRRTDYPCTWNGLKREEVETEEDEKELESFSLREHFLGNWAVQVQD